MPKIIDYPRAALSRALEVAEAVDSLGGDCTLEMCANQMNRRVGGAFRTMVGAAAKYGLIESARQRLSTTQRYRDYKLAYSEEQARNELRSAFLAVPVFLGLAERFNNKKIPVGIFDKLLIREFDVSEAEAKRVAGYFMEGAEEVGLLNADGILKLETEAYSTTPGKESEIPESTFNPADERMDAVLETSAIGNEDYSILIRGPGMHSQITLASTEDLLIVDAMLQKIKKKLEIAGE